MKRKFCLAALAALLTAISHAGTGPEEKNEDPGSGQKPVIKATASNGQSVLLVESSAPKVAGILPPGWKVVPLQEATIESEPFLIRSGLSSVITVNPYKLIPDPKQAPYALKEPGFDSSLGNHQTSTVEAVLSNYIREEEKLDQKLGSAIDQLRTDLNRLAAVENGKSKQPLQAQNRP